MAQNSLEPVWPVPLTVRGTGQSRDLRARPASTAPARPHAEESETQAGNTVIDGPDINFKCYGDVVTVLDGENKLCPESEPSRAPTVAPVAKPVAKPVAPPVAKPTPAPDDAP